MSLDGERRECHVAGLGFGCLGCDTRGLDILDNVLQELPENWKGRAGRIWVDLDVGVLCGDRINTRFRVKGDDGLLECF